MYCHRCSFLPTANSGWTLIFFFYFLIFVFAIVIYLVVKRKSWLFDTLLTFIEVGREMPYSLADAIVNDFRRRVRV